MFKFNATVTFLGQRHKIGTFFRDYISLQMLKLAVGERLIQHVPIPWSGENRAVHSDSDLIDVLAEFEAKKVSQIHFITATNRRRMEVSFFLNYLRPTTEMQKLTFFNICRLVAALH
ncbi:hypothetical protein ACOSQ3_013606 [Xanthoceras sorbifolium]